jgi:hypothetical protein
LEWNRRRTGLGERRRRKKKERGKDEGEEEEGGGRGRRRRRRRRRNSERRYRKAFFWKEPERRKRQSRDQNIEYSSQICIENKTLVSKKKVNIPTYKIITLLFIQELMAQISEEV